MRSSRLIGVLASIAVLAAGLTGGARVAAANPQPQKVPQVPHRMGSTGQGSTVQHPNVQKVPRLSCRMVCAQRAQVGNSKCTQFKKVCARV